MRNLNPCLRRHFDMKFRSIGVFIILFLALSSVGAGRASAQGPEGKSFGFGLILGNILGGTVKGWVSPENALVADIGQSYFGSPRIQADYLWHFDAFHSRIVKMYAGPGLAIGFGNENANFRWHNEDYNTTTNSRIWNAGDLWD